MFQIRAFRDSSSETEFFGAGGRFQIDLVKRVDARFVGDWVLQDGKFISVVATVEDTIKIIFVLVFARRFNRVVTEVDLGSFRGTAFDLDESGDQCVSPVAGNELVSVLLGGEAEDVHSGRLEAGDVADADREARRCVTFFELHCFELAERAVGDPSRATETAGTG